MDVYEARKLKTLKTENARLKMLLSLPLMQVIEKWPFLARLQLAPRMRPTQSAQRNTEGEVRDLQQNVRKKVSFHVALQPYGKLERPAWRHVPRCALVNKSTIHAR
jgi:hypothetical protein